MTEIITNSTDLENDEATLVADMRDVLGEQPDDAHHVGVRSYVRRQPEAARAFIAAHRRFNAAQAALHAQYESGIFPPEIVHEYNAAQAALPAVDRALSDFTELLIKEWESR